MKITTTPDGQYQLYCVVCGRPGDIVCKAELDALSRGTYGPYTCITCDPTGANQVPVALASHETTYLLRIGKRWYVVNWERSAREATRRLYLCKRAFRDYVNDQIKAKK
jgi:hypothetical protein